MQSLTLINGSATRTLASTDRGFSYGQGVFTTIRASQGRMLLWDSHLKRLLEGCERLGFPISNLGKLLLKEIGILPKTDLVIKIVLTAGIGPRGYTTPAEIYPTRVIQIDPLPKRLLEPEPANLRLCTTRLSIQPALAGIKHLNRLEQVLGRSEWTDPDIQEGVMLDTEGSVVEGTYTNIFWVKGSQLFTPDLSGSGVAGVMRAQVIQIARSLNIPVEIGKFPLSSVIEADEVFLTNALVGILPVNSLAEVQLHQNELTSVLASRLNEVLGV